MSPAFEKRLRELGYATYEAYLEGPHWKNFRATYFKSKRPKVCAVCGIDPVQLHHHTYVRLGSELLTDVTPLCRSHHEAVHEWLKRQETKTFVEFTCAAVKAIRGDRLLAKRVMPIEPRHKKVKRSKSRKKLQKEAKELKKKEKQRRAEDARREAQFNSMVATLKHFTTTGEVGIADFALVQRTRDEKMAAHLIGQVKNRQDMKAEKDKADKSARLARIRKDRQRQGIADKALPPSNAAWRMYLARRGNAGT